MKCEEFANAILYHADCMDIMRSLIVDISITDPPYGMGNVVSVRGDDLDKVAIGPIATWDADFSAAGAPWPTDRVVAFTVDWRTPEWYARFPNGRLLAWRKTNPTPSIRKRMINSAEWIFASSHMRYRDFYNSQAVISGPFDTSPVRLHPSKKPDWLMTELVEMFSVTGETVLDPFMGSGTTGVACAKCGRKFIGIEIDPSHFDTACRRIEQAQRQGELLVSV